LKKIISKQLPYLGYFFKYLKYRLFIILFISIAVGVLDGFGLTMFIPLLEMISSNSDNATNDSLGNLSFVMDSIKHFNLEINLQVILFMMLLFFTLKGGAKWIEIYLETIFLQYFIRRLREDCIDSLANYKYENFVNEDAGVIQNALTTEVILVTNAYRNYNQILRSIFLVITYSSLAFLSNPEFAAIVLVGGLLMNFLFSRIYKQTKKQSKNIVTGNQDFQGLMLQFVAFFKYFTSTGETLKFREKLVERVRFIEESQKKIGILKAVVMGIREPVLIFIVVLTIIIQVQVMGGILASIILSLLFFYRGLTSVSQLQTSYNQFLSFSASLLNMDEFLSKLKKGRKVIRKFSCEPNGISGLELKNITFKYGNTEILRDISLTIPSNKTIAFVGESGSGKTTLMNILCGLLPPLEGDFLIEGCSYKQCDILILQKKIGYITQESVVFTDTLFNNVTLWDTKTEKNIKRFYEAIESAYLKELFDNDILHEDTPLGNSGITLSGGQRQRVSIARELYKDVKYLFLDEATSSLDSESENFIKKSIDKLQGEKTIIIIAHRLSTIKSADLIFLLENGKLAGSGTYSDLIQENRLFQRMIKLQQL